MKEKEVYTVREIAALTGFSRQTVTRILERGVIVVVRLASVLQQHYRDIRIRHIVCVIT